MTEEDSRGPLRPEFYGPYTLPTTVAEVHEQYVDGEIDEDEMERHLEHLLSR